MTSVKGRTKAALKLCGITDKDYRDRIVKTAKKLLKMNDVEIISHRSPDGDTLGSAAALCRGMRQLGKRVNFVCADTVPAKYAFMFEGVEPQSFEPKHCVTVDIAAPHLMGKIQADYENKIDLCIDHHMSNTIQAPVKLVDEDASAVGELIWMLLNAMGVTLQPEIASCLFAAISTDTGCFKYSNVTQRTHLIAADLMKYDVACADINFKLIDEETKAKMELKKLALATLDYSCSNRCAIITITKEMMEASGASAEDTDGIASIPRTISGVDCGMMMKEVEDGWKVSIRSNQDVVNAAELCGKFGGGGHAAAAGCKLSMTYDEAKKALVDAAAEILGK